MKERIDTRKATYTGLYMLAVLLLAFAILLAFGIVLVGLALLYHTGHPLLAGVLGVPYLICMGIVILCFAIWFDGGDIR